MSDELLTEAQIVVRERLAFATGAAWLNRDRLSLEMLFREAAKRYAIAVPGVTEGREP